MSWAENPCVGLTPQPANGNVRTFIHSFCTQSCLYVSKLYTCGNHIAAQATCSFTCNSGYQIVGADQFCAAGVLGGTAQSCASKQRLLRALFLIFWLRLDIDACIDNDCGAGFICTDFAPPADDTAAGRNCTDINACINNPCQTGLLVTFRQVRNLCCLQASLVRICPLLPSTMRLDALALVRPHWHFDLTAARRETVHCPGN